MFKPHTQNLNLNLKLKTCPQTIKLNINSIDKFNINLVYYP